MSSYDVANIIHQALSHGYDHVVDDPDMDWSRFCHGGRVVSLDPGLALLMPTVEAAAVAALVAARCLAQGAAASDDFEHLAFNEAIFLPSHGAYVAPGVMRRTLNYLCFANSKVGTRAHVCSTVHCTVHSTIPSPKSTFHRPHSILHSSHSTLHTPHSTLHTPLHAPQLLQGRDR